MRRRCLLLSIPAVLLGRLAAAGEAPVTVFAAASLTDAMRDIDQLWQAAGHPPLQCSFASSSTLARQIEQGAPAQLFASADEQWADWLERRNLLAPGTRQDLLTNSLVLVMSKATAYPVAISPNLDLSSVLGPDGRLAVGDPAHVPAGIYAKQALIKLGLWPQAESRLAPAEDVRGALLLVERGEAPAGIVYTTDAAVSSGVAIAGIFPENSHPAIRYPFALVKGGDTPQAQALLAFLAGPQARDAFSRRGFGVE